MDEGLNIMYFARKEQCLALGAQLRTKFKPRIESFAIYRVFPNGETQYLHPKDGVFPEKVCAWLGSTQWQLHSQWRNMPDILSATQAQHC